MCKVYFILPLLLFFVACQAQQGKEASDSLALISRTKADKVLNQFNSLSGAKILYSLKDQHYYVIIQKGSRYQEYYVSLDSLGKVEEIQTLKSREENRKLLSQSFDLDKYHSGFVTRMPDATYVRGVPSYFVIKDQDGNRYGEYSLSSLTLPAPIAGNLYSYLTKRLSEEISSRQK